MANFFANRILRLQSGVNGLIKVIERKTAVTERENGRQMETCELTPEKRGESVSEWVSE